jgi:hypothetical protein
MVLKHRRTALKKDGKTLPLDGLGNHRTNRHGLMKTPIATRFSLV